MLGSRLLPCGLGHTPPDMMLPGTLGHKRAHTVLAEKVGLLDPFLTSLFCNVWWKTWEELTPNTGYGYHSKKGVTQRVPAVQQKREGGQGRQGKLATEGKHGNIKEGNTKGEKEDNGYCSIKQEQLKGKPGNTGRT